MVISVPAYFSDEQRKHTRLAAELAGLNAVRLINEPTAAAMAYGLHTQQNTRSLVFDLGGGTFDVTVLEYATPVIEVHASAGDNFLGGEDFTHMLVDEVLKRADVARTTLNESELAALYACVEAAKCSNQSPLHIRWQYQEETRECEFYENELEDFWLPLLNRLRVPIEQAFARCASEAESNRQSGAGWRRVTNAAGAANRRASVWQITVSKLRSEHHCRAGRSNPGRLPLTQ
ncbi:hypothetical protein AWN70_24455 [Escherichia coli]|nr:hypothetical protein AWN70_24455 [Escherichia coli]